MYKEYLQKLENLKGAERIDLGSVKELQKQITDMKSAMKWVTGKLDEGDRYLKELEKYRQFSLSVYSKLIKLNPKMHEKAQKILDKFTKAAKDLGVDVGGVSEVKEIPKLISETEEKIKRTQTLIKKFESKGFK